MSVLVGKTAPPFHAKAVVNGQIVENFSLDQYLEKKYVLLFFYPKDFTFVCPTELHAFQDKLHEFRKRNVEVIACSTDTEYSHFAWLNTPKSKGGIQGVTYPIVADTNKTISADFDVLAGEYIEDEHGCLSVEGELVAYRGLFLIDKKGVIQHQLVNHMALGRNVDEALRLVDALQYCEKHGEVCPANWTQGQKAMKETQEGLNKYFA
jgi:peroxiredoxin (alkyl hydroperoxide reductase subunit C)